MEYRSLFFMIIMIVSGISILPGRIFSAADTGKKEKEPVEEVRLHLGPVGPAPEEPREPRLKPSQKQPPPAHRVTVTERHAVPGPPPRQRHLEFSSEQLVVAAFDEQGQEITRVVVADPRLVRGETLGPSGKLTSEIFYRDTADLTIILPQDSRIKKLKLYHPNWTGREFILEPIGETLLP